MQEVLDWFESRSLNAYSISSGQALLYNTLFPKHKVRLGLKACMFGSAWGGLLLY